MNIRASFTSLAGLRALFAAGSLIAASLFQTAVAGPVPLAEIPDAGDTLATAQDARGSGLHLLISGNLSNESQTPDWVDMYRVGHVSYPFTASTTYDPTLLADPVLFLFDSSGSGVAMDDESGGNAQAFMQLLSGLPAGDYYLAIAFAGMEPLDGGGNPIFDTFGSGALSSPQPLASWFGSPFAIDPGIVGDYQLGVQSVDEPATPLLAALAFGVAAGMRRRRASVR